MVQGWAGTEGDVALAVAEQNERLLDTYRADPSRLEQDANIERSIAEGAYARRQLFELLQNAADAMRDTPSGRCEVVLTDSTLYVANSGEPLSVDGALTLLATHKSAKRDEQIGRFGLGFKSVLAVSDAPKLFSRSGSMVFDKHWSDEMLSRQVSGQPHYPITRMARPVDPAEWFGNDSVLQSMAEWAATVVVLPLKGARDDLAESIAKFPAEFLLFSRHVERLDLEDRTAGRGRQMTLAGEGDLLILDDAGRRSSWVVVSRRHTPSKEAFAEGGYQAARDSVEIVWAAPVEGKPLGVGLFWAFFPTATQTTLSGIVNAPWKLADDRESLLTGAFNAELLEAVLPGLVVEALPRIFAARGAGATIDVLPARGREARSAADALINKPIMDAVADAPTVPSLGGTLRHPTRIRVHPEGLRPEELALWRSVCPDPEWWLDHSLTSPERRSKVQRLLAAHGRTEVGLRDWVEHIARDGSVEGSAVAVRLVAMISEREPLVRGQLDKARVLLLEDGSLDACRPGQVFLPGGTREAGRLYIDSRLAGVPEVRHALNGLGIRVLDSAGALRSELTAHSIDWSQVWISSRRNSVDEAEAVFRDVFGDQVLVHLRVRTRSGAWRKPNNVLLPGRVIPPDARRDAEVLVDPLFHRSDLELMERLGLLSEPQGLVSPPEEAWRVAAEERLRQAYREHVGQRSLRDEDIDIDVGRIMWPLQPLQYLSDEGRAELTHSVVDRLDPGHTWTIRRAKGGRTSNVDDPTWGYLRKHGYLRTQIGPQPVTRVLRHDSEVAQVDGVPQPLPVVEWDVSTDVEEALRLFDHPSHIRPEDWVDLLDQARGWTAERRTLLYAWAAFCGQPPPSRVRATKGPGFIDLPPDQVAVTYSSNAFQSLANADCPALLASLEDARVLIEEWGLAVGEELLEETLAAEPAGEPFNAVDRYPPLKASLAVEFHDVRIQPCDRLELLTSTPTGQKSRPLSEHRDGKTVFTTATQDRDILLSLGRALDQAIRPEVVLRRMEEQRRARLRVQIAETEDVLDKLVSAIGVEPMRKRIPAAALSALVEARGEELQDRDIARLALSVDGYRILQEHTAELERNGLNPPSQWAGRSNAREWVRDLGFPLEYAGFPGDRRDAEIEVEGPPILGELHDYQERIAARIKGLLADQAEIRRGLVALPTGAGKTRVAVQALVEYMSESPRPAKIVWVAETDELCEQAVQTWSQVWRALGRAGMPLTLSRLWGSNSADERYGHQVIVATIAKLDSIVKRGDGVWDSSYAWLADPTIIVVDEAHRSIGPQYTGALSRLGGAKRVADMTTPLLGLTATPFRGWNERETEVLAGRYHRNQLDVGVFPGGEPYAYLQEMGVLARVNHVALEGAELAFTDEELRDVQKYNRVPEGYESRLGRHERRNNTIVQSMLEMPHDATALLFATSVENARVLAALLTYHGIESRAVSGGTDPAARRRYIDDFKARDVRVLTNYNVFTEGFDVPSVDAVYITRPTFSPNIYQQMIGRGLRGPLNGGKPEVLVVNVEDNITNYGESFAFRHFEHLWNGEKADHDELDQEVAAQDVDVVDDLSEKKGDADE